MHCAWSSALGLVSKGKCVAMGTGFDSDGSS